MNHQTKLAPKKLAMLLTLLQLPITTQATETEQYSANPTTFIQTKTTNFKIDKTETTIYQYKKRHTPEEKHTKAEKEGGGYEYDAGWVQRKGWYWHTPYGKPANSNEPAVHINWFEAQEYCQSLGGRLPTFNEWKQAAYTESRGQPTDGYEKGNQYPYPVGDEPTGMNTSGDDPWPHHAPAGATKRGVNGLYDMGANVWEWIADTKDDQALTAGGSWWYGAEKTRVNGAQFKPKEFAAVYIGFRCLHPIDRAN